MMKQTKTAFIFLLSLAQSVFAAKIERVCDDSKTLTVNASGTGFTRISVKGDKLKDVMGLEEDVLVEKNETEGILFLKNIKNKQTITLITEGGLIQDVTLLPGGSETMNIVLKPDSQPKRVESTKHSSVPEWFADAPIQPFSYTYSQQNHSPMPHRQEIMIQMMKQLHAGAGETSKQNTPRSSSTGCEAILTRTLQAHGFIGDVFTLTNTKDSPTILLEKDFYQQGDGAIALVNTQLEAGERTFLFVIRSDRGV